MGEELVDVLIGPSIELLVDVCTLWCSYLTHCTFYIYIVKVSTKSCSSLLLPARASEQGNVIGSVRIYIYIYVYKKKL